MDPGSALPLRDRHRAWWPLTRSKDVNAAMPLGRRLFGVPVVLFRDPQGRAVTLHDRCPHRHAPLSRGRICGGELQCPYHGWRFDAEGHCTAVPGLPTPRQRRPLVTTLATREHDGLVWACPGDPDPAFEPTAPAVFEGVDVFFMTDTVRCGMAEAAENFLDGFHTHFVHAGWLRHDARRQSVRAEVTRLADGIQVRYEGEAVQSGLISGWLERGRTESFGRFRWPGLAEIEYRNDKGLSLLVSAWLTPEDDHSVLVHARIATRRGLMPRCAKHAVLRHLFRVILQQDKRILEAAHANQLAFAQKGQLRPRQDTPLDLLAPSIRQLIAGEDLSASVEKCCHLML